MIKANELRFGNWLLATGSLTKGYYHQVTGIQEDLIFFGPVALSLNNLAGIDVTPDILEKCGFSPVNDDPEFAIYSSRKNRTFIFKQTDYPHLHQLQNLYFSLTGNELEVKL